MGFHLGLDSFDCLHVSDVSEAPNGLFKVFSHVPLESLLDPSLLLVYKAFVLVNPSIIV